MMKNYPPGALWPVEDDVAAQIREVYARFGLAMYKAQVLEHAIVNATVVATILPTMRQYPDRAAWDDAFDRAYEAELAKTFGNMLKSLNSLPLPTCLRRRLDSAKVVRDSLAHRFFREHDEDFLSAAGRTKMIAECEAAIELFDRIDVDLEGYIKPKLEQFGITEDWIEQQMEVVRLRAESEG